MPVVVLICGVALLFFLIIVVKLNGFLSLLLAALFVGFFQGMDGLVIVQSIETGLGGTLGHLGIIIALGAIFGKLVSEGGGAQRIADTLIKIFGVKHVDWALCITSFILGAILFWEVSFVLIVPIVYTVAVEANVKLMKVGIPFFSAISITHCFLPPHPGPVAIASVFDANIGVILAYGLILAIPAAILFGPLWQKMYKNWEIEIPHQLVTQTKFEESELPSFGMSVLIAVSPVILILLGVIAQFWLPKDSMLCKALTFIGNADIALLIALIIAIYAFGLRGKKRRTMPELMKSATDALLGMGSIIFVLGGGGAFKQVILDSGMADYIASATSGWDISPYVLVWIIGCCVRLAVGSATVTVLTTAAIALPILQSSGANPELMVLAIGAASIFFGPPSDVSFWFAKEYFNLTIPQVVKFWCIQSSCIAIYGILGVLLLSAVF